MGKTIAPPPPPLRRRQPADRPRRRARRLALTAAHLQAGPEAPSQFRSDAEAAGFLPLPATARPATPVSQRHPGIVDHDPMMGGQCQFPASPSARPAIAAATGLPAVSIRRSAWLRGKKWSNATRRAPGRRRHDHVVGRSQLRQVGTRTERRWLSRADHDPLDVTSAQPFAEGGQFGDGRIGENVHGPARHVENQVQNVVFGPFRPELFNFPDAVIICSPLARLLYSILYICVLVSTRGFAILEKEAPLSVSSNMTRIFGVPRVDRR